jgi:hypothetical protein
LADVEIEPSHTAPCVNRKTNKPNRRTEVTEERRERERERVEMR